MLNFSHCVSAWVSKNRPKAVRKAMCMGVRRGLGELRIWGRASVSLSPRSRRTWGACLALSWPAAYLPSLPILHYHLWDLPDLRAPHRLHSPLQEALDQLQDKWSQQCPWLPDPLCYLRWWAKAGEPGRWVRKGRFRGLKGRRKSSHARALPLHGLCRGLRAAGRRHCSRWPALCIWKPPGNFKGKWILTIRIASV